jgi:hypothetical protein
VCFLGNKNEVLETYKVKLSLWLINMPWGRMGDFRYISTILDLGTRRRWVISFTSRPLCLQGKSPPIPTCTKKLSVLQSRRGRCGAQKNIIPFPGIEPGRSAHKTVYIPTVLARLPYYKCISFSELINNKFILLTKDTAWMMNNVFVEHRKIYVLHPSPFSLAVSWWTTVEPTRGK